LVLRRLRGIFGRGEALPPRNSSVSTRRNARGSGRRTTRCAASKPRWNTTRRPKRPSRTATRRETSACTRSASPKSSSVAHPYERLASLYERRRDYGSVLRVSEAYVRLATSGTLPRGAQRSADRKLPQFEARVERYRRSLDKARSPPHHTAPDISKESPQILAFRALITLFFGDVIDSQNRIRSSL
jgi:hypothetical protein